MNTLRRAATAYGQGGCPAIRQAVARRYQAWARHTRPLLWLRLGAASRLAARLVPLQAPPILILSVPRSGSSWVGSTLGSAANAAYLREPLTQYYLAHGGRDTLTAFPAGAPPPAYRAAAQAAFGGLAHFDGLPAVIHQPRQWSLLTRRQRRLVIKEVNPHLLPWLGAAYRPRVIYLVRHPAAVALSFRKMGWWSAQPDHWRRAGQMLAAAQQAAAAALSTLPAARVVDYDALCASPRAHFAELFEFAGLQWDASIEALIRQQTTTDDSENPMGIRRDSRQQIARWRGEISKAELCELRAGYCEVPLPWHQQPEDW